MRKTNLWRVADKSGVTKEFKNIDEVCEFLEIKSKWTCYNIVRNCKKEIIRKDNIRIERINLGKYKGQKEYYRKKHSEGTVRKYKRKTRDVACQTKVS